MACEGCIQKIKADNEQKEQAFKLAQQKANETGEWYAVFFDREYIALPASTPGYPFTQYFSPELQHANS